ncbi:MAG: DNA primase [Lachnospiraceae bacterium]|nr:DNA primase [Lachnospiraceae bacterium]
MRYPDELLDRVRDANDIVDVVSACVPLKKRGANYVGLCPFHAEKTGSFNVSPNRQIFKCFGCGKGGNVFNFVMEYENLTFPESVKLLAARAGIELPENPEDDTPEKRLAAGRKEKILAALKDAAAFYYRTLRSEEGIRAQQYLLERGLDEETINRFGLGYAGKGGVTLYDHLKKLGHSDEALEGTGLFTGGKNGMSDRFFNRVIFPIMDRSGKVIAFGGRLMGTASKAPKYLNSPETPVFFKGSNIYGLNIAKRTSSDTYLLCEGYMDVIALHKAGFDSAVASLGTALTPVQAKLLRRFTSRVALTYDSDGAGQAATLRAIPILRGEGLDVRVVNLSPRKDPDEFIKEYGADAYRERLEKAESAFFFEMEAGHAGVKPDDPVQLQNFNQMLVESIARYDDEMVRYSYIKASCAKYGMAEEVLTRAVNKEGLRLREEREKAEKEGAFPVNPETAYSREAVPEAYVSGEAGRRIRSAAPKGKTKSEHMLISLLATHPGFISQVRKDLSESDFEDRAAAALLKCMFIRSDNAKPVDPSLLAGDLTGEDLSDEAGRILMGVEDEDLMDDEAVRKAFCETLATVLNDSFKRNGRAMSFADIAKRRKNIDLLITNIKKPQ